MTQTVEHLVGKEPQVGANSVQLEPVGQAVASEVFLPAVPWGVKEANTIFWLTTLHSAESAAVTLRGALVPQLQLTDMKEHEQELETAVVGHDVILAGEDTPEGSRFSYGPELHPIGSLPLVSGPITE